jgi:hypothetical protein
MTKERNTSEEKTKNTLIINRVQKIRKQQKNLREILDIKNLKNSDSNLRLEKGFFSKKDDSSVCKSDCREIKTKSTLSKNIEFNEELSSSDKKERFSLKNDLDVYMDKILFEMINYEKKWLVIKKENVDNSEISKAMRFQLIEWLIKIHSNLKMRNNSLLLALNILENYSINNYIKKSKYQLIGLTCLLIAAKYEEIYPRKIKEYVMICDNAFSKEEIIETEAKILNFLNFDLYLVTPLNFLDFFMKKFNLNPDFYGLCVKHLVFLCLDNNYFSINCRAIVLAVMSFVKNKYNFDILSFEELVVSTNNSFTTEYIFNCSRNLSNFFSYHEKNFKLIFS